MSETKVIEMRQTRARTCAEATAAPAAWFERSVPASWRGIWALLLVCLASAIGSPGQTVIDFFNFNGTDGKNPNGPVAQGLDGGMYGTTQYGGAYGDGTVFKLTISPKKLTTLYNFCAKAGCSDGAIPQAGLILGTDGNYYGTTSSGGLANSPTCPSPGCGTVFKITPNGTLTTLHKFCSQSNCTDGWWPRGGLVQASDGNFYGTTLNGGANNTGYCAPGGCGTVFRITRGGTLTTLYSFCPQAGCLDGSFPTTGLIQGTDGNLYGTTSSGPIYKITLTGVFLSVNNEFNNYDAPLFQASDGNFYGTINVETSSPYGTVFRMTSAGVMTTLYNFCSQTNCADGYAPLGGLVEGSDGNLYGATSYGGASGSGTMFRITFGGVLTTLGSFGGGTKGYPKWMFQDTGGNFYPANVEKSGDYGEILQLTAGLGPFVETVPISGKIGSKVVILGTSLTGATAVSFDGKAATFSVVSPSEITTTVPTGATTGIVQVTTAKGTVSSIVAFQVP
jgi:uncharacterized repeat protein (TIGR03803 family)